MRRAQASLPPLSPLRHLLPLVWRQWRHQPWRHALVALAVALGVALAFAVALINRSALAEFNAAVRATGGEPDLVLRGGAAGLPEALLERMRLHRDVRLASPVVEAQTYVRAHDGGERVAVRVLGVDALALAELAPQLLPRPAAGEDRLAALDPDAVFVNAAARARLGLADGATLQLQHGSRWQALRLAGSVSAGGAPLLVMDVAAAQQRLGPGGRLSRIDLRLQPGVDAATLAEVLALPAGVRAARPDEAERRQAALSRAYRVNLAVLALVALFVGGFLVYAVVSLSIAQRTPALALLAVLGLSASRQRALVLAECALLGLLGSALGLLLGAAMAAAALRFVGGDLGGGYFAASTAPLRVPPGMALLYALLGVVTAVVGGWVPARRAAGLAPAQALKGSGGLGGFGGEGRSARTLVLGLALLPAAAQLALLPAVAGVPVAAYASVAALLLGGVTLVPAAVQGLLRLRGGEQHPLLLLARRRAAHERAAAGAAVGAVLTSLALAVAITVMVASFRHSIADWLETMLPADLYARMGSSATAEQAWFGADLAAAAAALPGVRRVQAQRVRLLALDPALPALTLLARPLQDPARELPLRGATVAPAPGQIGVWISEAGAALHRLAPGDVFVLPLPEGAVQVRVRGIWRDYARQSGSLVIDHADYLRASGDARFNELALWLEPGAIPSAVPSALRAAHESAALLDFATTTELRATSLRIFERSFAVTTYLQAAAIAIGLVGVAASLAAQVLARRREFGLLAHLGLTRGQVLAVVTGEAAVWLLVGTVLGLVLGVAIGALLVFVVNPQSFHWTMELALPGARLAALGSVVLVTGIAAAAWTARLALARSAVLAVREDG